MSRSARGPYVAPTEAECGAGGNIPTRAGVNTPPPSVTRALDAIAPARGNLPVRVQAAGGAGTIRAVVELDAVTAKQPESISRGTRRSRLSRNARGLQPGRRLSDHHARNEPGQRSIPIDGTTDRSPPAAIRFVPSSLRGAAVPHSGDHVYNRAEGCRAGWYWRTGAAARPHLGLAYVPTADPRFPVPSSSGSKCRSAVRVLRGWPPAHARRAAAASGGELQHAHRREWTAACGRRSGAGAAGGGRICDGVVVDQGWQDGSRQLRIPTHSPSSYGRPAQRVRGHCGSRRRTRFRSSSRGSAPAPTSSR